MKQVQRFFWQGMLGAWIASHALGAYAQPELGSGMSSGLLQLLMSMGVLVALLYGIQRWLTRSKLGARGRAASSVLQVLGAKAVGPKEKVVLVCVGGRVLLLGVGGASGVTLLNTFSAQEWSDCLAQAEAVKTQDLAQDSTAVK